jgi:hypothetical protein
MDTGPGFDLDSIGDLGVTGTMEITQTIHKGRPCERAGWDRPLTPEEVAALAAGASPLDLDRGHLLFYAPLLGPAVAILEPKRPE